MVMLSPWQNFPVSGDLSSISSASSPRLIQCPCHACTDCLKTSCTYSFVLQHGSITHIWRPVHWAGICTCMAALKPIQCQ